MSTALDRMQERVLSFALGTFILSFLAWAGWVSVTLMNNPTRHETIEMIENFAPYVKDQAIIMRAIDTMQDHSKEMQASLDKNTAVIQEVSGLLKALHPLVLGAGNGRYNRSIYPGE